MFVDGNVHSYGPIHIPQSVLFGAFEQVAQATGRVDGESIYEFHRRVDAEALGLHLDSGRHLPRGLIERWHADQAAQGIRQDALPLGGVSTFPNELEFMRVRELETIRAELNAERLFPKDTSVPIGAREHGWFRQVGGGEAVVTKGDTQNYGHAQTGRVKETFDIIYIVCAVRQTYFEMLSTDYAGVNQYAHDLRQAYRLVDEKRNGILWNGWTPAKVFGALNHPQLLKKTLSVTIGGSSTSSATAIATAVQALVDAPATYSREAMQPTTLAVSPKIFRHIAQTQHSAGTDTSILKWIMQGQDSTNGIRRIVKVQELAGVGPNGEDGLLAYRDEQDAVSNIEVMPTMTMPVYQGTATSYLTLVISATGGVVMPDVGHNILGLASAP